MLQPRIPTICLHCRLSAASYRSYATAAPLAVQAVTQDAAVKSSRAVPEVRRGGNQFLRSYKPRTPGLRHLRRPINDHLWKGGPVRRLTFPKVGHGKGGRNNTGRVTVRHRGGGVRRRIRTVDFHRMEAGKQLVERIEYDPNRSAHIALLEHSLSKVKSYIIAADGMRAGDVVESFRRGITREMLNSMGGVIDPGLLAARTAHRGNCLPVHMVPIGTQIYNLGSRRDRGAVFCRSAGTYAQIMTKEEDETGKVVQVVVRLQSGELRRVHPEACATIGVASNTHWHFRQLGKAGRSRWLNIRPTVRGLAMNANDHPHGGGRGKSKGNVHPVSIWGRTPVSFSYNMFDVYRLTRSRPKEGSRHAARATPTDSWLQTGHVIKGNVEAKSKVLISATTKSQGSASKRHCVSSALSVNITRNAAHSIDMLPALQYALLRTAPGLALFLFNLGSALLVCKRPCARPLVCASALTCLGLLIAKQ